MSVFRVLHFDDGATYSTNRRHVIHFSTLLKSRLYRTFADRNDFELESYVIDSDAAFSSLLNRIEELRIPQRSVDLVLIDLRLDLRPPMAYQNPDELEGLMVARKIAAIDPNRERIHRAFLTRTRHRGTLSPGSELPDLLLIDFLSKDPLPSNSNLWTRNEAFPENVVLYIADIATKTGKWS